MGCHERPMTANWYSSSWRSPLEFEHFHLSGGTSTLSPPYEGAAIEKRRATKAASNTIPANFCFLLVLGVPTAFWRGPLFC
ncbi:hypothetical protein MLD38_017661 [Melastoma candidum]|uniref:Uncharacterized protein n=1 Tax=Melastoma candidum TaxID=119954 RepID=A0ACB9QRV6_9MYRT|nr:hypothetical protein MLD38_017661 [Melastoma candidum]